jgi:hypothetical protein
MLRCGFEIDATFKKVFMYDYDIPYVKYSELPDLKKYRYKFYLEIDVTIPIIRQRIDKKYEPGSDEMKKLEEHFNSLHQQ